MQGKVWGDHWLCQYTVTAYDYHTMQVLRHYYFTRSYMLSTHDKYPPMLTYDGK